ncbi:uncharacterized protein At1g76660-like isoform X2 [Salvia splendens]|uniref:uncharacterized protein At1g76660-like isoform X2 n=1 Tax=Salvia splendens TaxID=180675 RepID=UPI001C27BEB2|nr:uncharacterized protein At1g76660-like isoform X2 [Salvia splendens]XP_042024865.1 uncharacterized protein At1g76660-like isoform X2 [Salvia splendens]
MYFLNSKLFVPLHVSQTYDSEILLMVVQKRRWGSFWSLYWCFGPSKNKRIGHAILVPEGSASGADSTRAEHSSQPPSVVFPFVAPPSSPASFLPSETPSATQSPGGILSMTSVSANMYSPGGPASMFAIGPYAHETQLVSPPVFSTFTTEPSTAPYTPPPESVHMTTPSSPEVPFARLLEPNLQNGQRYPFSQYEFQSYQLQPGSPVSHLISPSSGISGSGTSSPFPDREFAAAGHPFFLEFRTGNPPKLLELNKIVIREWESRQASGAVTPDAAGPRSHDNCLLNRQDSDVSRVSDTGDRLQNEESAVSHRVSFEITDEEVIRCVEKKPVALQSNMSSQHVTGWLEKANAGESLSRRRAAEEGEMEGGHQKKRTITLGSSKEFNFENVDEASMGSSEWFVGEEGGGHNEKWSFFPMMQTGVS